LQRRQALALGEWWLAALVQGLQLLLVLGRLLYLAMAQHLQLAQESPLATPAQAAKVRFPD
jgi:hypothetical protein